MSELYLYESDSLDVYYNQAVEKYLLEKIKEDQIALYLWRNDQTVVIGRNQDAYSECHIETLTEDGGFLARRISGGGAVYHDKGNLNFTFICPKKQFDIARQEEIILDALNDLGINAEKNGRNDLLVKGKKFSGHAYYRGNRNCLHHGTLMLEVNEEALSRYLNVSLIKLKSKNVRSVRSRIINLKAVRNDLSIDMLKEALIASFEKMYQSSVSTYKIDEKEVLKIRKDFASKDWLFGRGYKDYRSKEGKTDFGTVKIFYKLKQGIITDLKIYTDALDHDLPADIEKELIGKRIEETENEKEETKAIIRLLKEEKDEI